MSFRSEDLAEYDRRLTTLRGLMRDHGFDAIVASDGTATPPGHQQPRYARYISGFDTTRSGRRQPVVVVPLSGEPTLVVAPGMVRSFSTLARSASWISNVVSTYSEDSDWELRTRWGAVTDTASDVVEAVRTSGLERARIGMAGTWAAIDETKAAFPNARFEPTVVTDRDGRPTDLLEPLIGANSPWEINKLELAQAAADSTMQAFLAAAKEGATIRETTLEAKIAAMRAGADNVRLMGSVSLDPWAFGDLDQAAADQQFEQGKMYCLELAECDVAGYLVQSARTFVVGSPTKPQRHLFDAVQRSREAILEAVEVGKTGGQLWAVGIDPINKAGLEPWAQFGHFMGFDPFGPQRLSVFAGNSNGLYEGEAVMVHPAVVDKAEGLFSIAGDSILVEKNGWRFLSARPPVHELTN